MTNQVQGELLFKGWAGTSDANTWAYTPWMPVRGDYATFAVELIAVNGTSMTLTWGVQTRTLEDPAVTQIIDDQTMTTVSTKEANNNNESMTTVGPAEQLVRYRYSTGSTASSADYVVFRALQPSWITNR